MKDSWKYVSVKQCIGTIIFCIIALCTIFIPYLITENGIEFSFKFLPFIGEESSQAVLKLNFAFIAERIQTIIPSIPENVLNFLPNLFEYVLYVFFGALLLNVVFSILLAIFRSDTLRMFFRTFSVLLGIVLIVSTLIWLLYILVEVYSIITLKLSFDVVYKEHGIIFIVGVFVFSLILSIKQFKWYTKPY